MSDLYAHLKRGDGRAQALRAAQLAFLTPTDHDDASPRRAHPAFWAAFSLVGDWAPLPGRLPCAQIRTTTGVAR
jgi:CHAT domain-containing protein